jgi:phosphoglycerate dehydrogenase-like enzyme
MRVVLCTRNAAAQIAAGLRSIAGGDLLVVENPQELPKAIEGADALFCPDFYFSADLAGILASKQTPLRWIQLLTAGYDNVSRFGVPSNVTVTSAGKAFAPSVALHAIALLLALCRQMPATFENQQVHGWDRSFMERLLTPEGMTVAILGMGNIGEKIAELLQPWKPSIIGVSRTRREHPFAAETSTLADLASVLPRSDAIFVSLPLNSDTRQLLNAQRLSQCKRSSLLINISRGAIVDHSALAEALERGTIGGAALDVTEPEPLPPGHPLWDAPNLIVSPHVAGSSGAVSARRLAAMAADNLQRFLAGHELTDRVAL